MCENGSEEHILNLISEVKPKIFAIKENIKFFCQKHFSIGLYYEDLDNFITKEITKIGGAYYFPNCISIGNIVAHDVCDIQEKRLITSNKINIDFGLVYKNLIPIDTAFTIFMNPTEDEKELLLTTKRCLKSIKKIINCSTSIYTLAKHIENFFCKKKYILADLSGHTLTPECIHAEKYIPSIANFADKTSHLEIGDFFTVEPYVALRNAKNKNDYEQTFEDSTLPSEAFKLGKVALSLKILIKSKEEKALNLYKNNRNETFQEIYPIKSINNLEFVQEEETFYVSKKGAILVSNLY